MSHNDVRRQADDASNKDDELQLELEPIPMWLRIAMAIVCTLNMAAIAYIAVLIGIQKGWKYSIHCFFLCLFAFLFLIQLIRAQSKFHAKAASSSSYFMFFITLSTSFTLLIRQAYYHPSSGYFGPEWVLFSLQAGIIPGLVGMVVMFEFSLQEIYKSRFIIMVAVLDFADIWDMASMLSPVRAPYIEEQSPIEIAIQYFCSTTFLSLSAFLNKVIIEEYLKIFMGQSDVSQEGQSELHRAKDKCCTAYVKMNSRIYQDIPFLIIRIFVLLEYGFVDVDFLFKNAISAIIVLFDCCKGCCFCCCLCCAMSASGTNTADQ
ncbi:hypothetical protein AC249_AIPGENE20580 [Exaiptasia diaphana]|nr:hypothetical protein AC249_AIPGENE20580 [Exaiptasia diaphana]